MKALIIILALILTTPAPRCRIETNRGQAYLVCPCRTSYQCEDWYRVPRSR